MSEPDFLKVIAALGCIGVGVYAGKHGWEVTSLVLVILGLLTTCAKI